MTVRQSPVEKYPHVGWQELSDRIKVLLMLLGLLALLGLNIGAVIGLFSAAPWWAALIILLLIVLIYK